MTTAYDGESLDPQTIEALETSLGMKILKLFAIISKADQYVSDQERQFVSTYWEELYPSQISGYLFERYEEHLQTSQDLEVLAQNINAQMSYQEKIFCLIKIFELIESDAISESEITLVRRVSGMLHLNPADLDYIECLFGLRDDYEQAGQKSAIISLEVNDSLKEADVFLPYPGLCLRIYKIFDLFCLVQKKTDGNWVLVDDQQVRRETFNRIPHNADILINNYVMRYQDLRIFFENKVHPIRAELFLNRQDGTYSWEREQTPASVFHLRLEGSRMQVEPLEEDWTCSVNDCPVIIEEKMYVNLDDQIVVGDNRFNTREVFFHLNREKIIPLERHKDVFEITNDARGDVYIADAIPDKWTARVYQKNGGCFISPEDCPYQVRVDGRPVKTEREILPGEVVFINNRYLSFDFEALEVKQIFFSLEKLSVQNLVYSFLDGTVGLDDVSFEVSYGELVCIMGPSGCGKSTLLSLICGFLKPKQGSITLGDFNVHRDFDLVKDYLGFVPQDDLLLGNLTVYENLYYYAKLRFPDRGRDDIDRQIDLVLQDVGLFEKKLTLVGSPIKKTLSGGERKRLNIGLELISNAEVYLLDEPTSGLSSKDSEKIIELLSNIAARGKLVLTVIHQPSSKIFSMFDKLILLDTGGSLAFFGPTQTALYYFNEHRNADHRPLMSHTDGGEFKSLSPDLLLDTMEESLRDIDGARLRDRKYTPQYWKEKYKRYVREHSLISAVLPKLSDPPPPKVLGRTERFGQFVTLLSRNFKSRIRDRSNLLITFLGAPVLGWGVAWVTKSSPHAVYNLYENDLYRLFLFTAVIMAMFFGMTNSVDEIINSRPIFLRERMLDVRHRAYLTAKTSVLIFFGILQDFLYLFLGFWVLEVRELFFEHVAFLSLVSLAGIAMGLFISSIPNISSKAAQNFIPLIMIPQLILGGALIKFDEMNDELWLRQLSPVPEICQLVPARWAYEGMVTLQANSNRFDAEYDRLAQEMNDLKIEKKNFKNKKDEVTEEKGEAYYQKELEQRDRRIDTIKKQRDDFMVKVGYKYGNAYIRSEVAHADLDYRDDAPGVYRMLVSHKKLPLINRTVETVVYNALVIFIFINILLALTVFMLKYRDDILVAVRFFRHPK